MAAVKLIPMTQVSLKTIVFVLLFFSIGPVISAEDRLIQEDIYFDGYTHALRYSIDGTAAAGADTITWYEGRFELRSIAEGPECFVVPGDMEWITCIITGTDGKKTTETFRVARDLPGSQRRDLSTVYLTLPKPGSAVILSGNPDSILGPDQNGAVLVNQNDGFLFYRLYAPGYYKFSLGTPEGPRLYKVFVSPVDSVYTDRVDRDWYYTQFNTTTTSNCGPTVVSMGITWATGQDVPVAEVRQIIGWHGTGAVNFRQMKQVLARYGVESEIVPLKGAEQIFTAIANDCLVGMLYDMSGISFQPNPRKNLFDQYYRDKGGHYLTLKGYSKDKRYFIIYDPIPSDWSYNAGRYSDGDSMYGRNRYYRVEELLNASTSSEILIIKRSGDISFTRLFK
jgi:hypothetical protein